MAAEASELLIAAHHSSPKIIVQDHAGDLAEAVETATGGPGTTPAGRDLLTTTPLRGLDVQCEDEAVFFTEELEHDDKADDFSDLVGRRSATQRSGLRTTLVVGGLALCFLGGAVWLIERKPTANKKQAAASAALASRATPAQARPQPSPRKAMKVSGDDAPGPMSPRPEPAVATSPMVAPPTAEPMTSTASPTALPPTALPPTTLPPSAMPPAAPPVVVQRPVTATHRPAVATPPPPSRTGARPAAEASVADQLAARASLLLARDRAQAQKLARAALAQNPSHPIARRVMARIFEGQAKSLLYSGANAAAARSARRALRFDPSRVNALFYLGVALNEQRRRTEASGVLTRFLKRCPSCGYNSMYARQLLTTNRRLAAAKAAAKAAMTAPSAKPAR